MDIAGLADCRARFLRGFGVGMARAGAPTHEIMAQGRWKSAGMVADYTRAENAERAAQWLG